MKDERMQPLLDAWFRDRDENPRDASGDIARVLADVPQTRQQGRWWFLPAFDRSVSTSSVRDVAPAPIRATNGRTSARGFTVFSTFKFIAAAVIAVLFGGFLLAGVLTTPQEDGEGLPAAVTESPSLMTTEELLSGMVTEEVEPGVLRVISDGVRDLQPFNTGEYRPGHVVVGQDGSIWLGRSGHLSRLGVAEDHDWQLGERDHLMDFEVASDGSVWVVTVHPDDSNDRDESALRSFDGETWTTHRAVDMRYYVGDVEIASDGVIWAALADGTLGYLDADGSTWRTIETPPAVPMSVDNVGGYGFIATESGVWVRYNDGVWRYADGAWERIRYRDPGTAAMPDEVFWGVGSGDTGSDETLYRHDETGWKSWSLKEQRMLGSWSIDPTAVAPDGSFWVGWPGRGALGTPDNLGVNRFDGQTWVRYLPGMSVSPFGMDIAPDGSVLLIAWEEEDRATEPFDPELNLYVITNGAVAATE